MSWWQRPKKRKRKTNADKQMLLTAAPEQTLEPSHLRVAISASEGTALSVALDDSPAGQAVKQALADASLPKAIHDSKAATHVLHQRGIELAGVQDDSLLYAYLLDPTYSRYALPDLAYRRFNLKTSDALGEAADLTLRLSTQLRDEVGKKDLRKVYDEIDLPMSPVLARMEDAGIRIDTEVLAEMSQRLERDANAKAREIWAKCEGEFNINSPKQLGDVLFNKLNLPKPVKYGKGKTISTAVDVLDGLAVDHEVPRLVLDYRQLSKLKSTYVDALPAMVNPRTGRVHTTFNHGGIGDGTAVIDQSQPAKHPHPHRTGTGDSCGVRR